MVSEWSLNPGPNTRSSHGQYTQNTPGHVRSQTPPTPHPVFSPAASNSPYSEQRQPQIKHETKHPLHRAQYAPDTYQSHSVSPEVPLTAMPQNAMHSHHSHNHNNHHNHDHDHDHNHASSSPAFAQYSHNSFLLDQLDAGYYDSPSSTGQGAAAANSQARGNTEFQLDSMDFIAPHNLGHESRAFPPSAYVENTPALGPSDRASQGITSVPPVVFQSPILPSQNSKSYNQEHLLQKQRQQQRSRLSTPMLSSQQQQQQYHHHSHSEHGFTPLVSPAVTPRESQVNSNTNHNHYAPAPTDFEPLTSPALKAQPEADRRRSSAAIVGDDYVHGNSAKRRTPHSTPKLSGQSSSVASKIKRSASFRKVPQQQLDFSLDPQQQQQKHETPQPLHSSESTPMLPPQGKKAQIDAPPHIFGFGSAPNANSNSNSSPAPGFGPGMLMGFTMNRLAEHQGGDGNNTPGSDSPSVASQPSSERERPALAHRGSMSVPGFTSSSETSPVLEAMTGGENGDSSEQGAGKRDRFPAKKTSHKIAEQGRRIRMNQAVHELSRLIPDKFHEGVTVPSKATTIEMAAIYIRNLQQEIESLKNRD